ncbi:hypothetical protein [Marinobacterium jannaschii]|uniref:hypothetical protein n=1 Tax=Marinobacterium jannaschii TaxID=64970 RepID=UPI000483529B|nr:hypothetical protein [Marinobacterium jannaschii]
MESENYSDAFTIKGLLNELSGPLKNGENAFSFSKLESGIRYNQFELALFIRNDYFAAFAPDTARLFYQGENNLPVDANSHYDIHLRLNNIQGKGIGFGYQLSPTNNFSLKPRLNILKATELTDGTITGSVDTDSSGSYSSQFGVNYAYSEDKLFERNVGSKPDGLGASIDLDAEWKTSDRLTLSLKVKDLFGRIRWNDAPATIASANTNNVALDSEGYIDTSPVLSGREINLDHTQKIPTRYYLTASTPLRDNLDLEGELFHIANLNFPRLHLKWQQGNYQLKTSLDTKAKALGISIGNRYCGAGIMSDSIDPDKAHSFNLNLSCQLPL